MIPYEPTSSGTSWWSKDVPTMWGFISDIDLEPMYQQTSGWQKAIDLASTNLYRLRDFRDKLTTAWPPEKSEASQQYVAQLDGLITSVQDVYDAAVANKTSASNLTSAISEAQRTVEPLYRKYVDNVQAQSTYDTNLANKKAELSSRYGGTTNRSYVYALNAYTNSNPNPNAATENAQITQQVRTTMSSLSTDLVVSSGKMVEPKPYQPPVLAGRDSGSGGTGGSSGSSGGSGGGGSGGGGSVPIVPMPAYVPPPQPTLTGSFGPPSPSLPMPAPTAPISTLPTPHPTAPIGMPTPVGPVGPNGVINPPKPPIGTGPVPGSTGRPGPIPGVIGPAGAGGRPGATSLPGARPGIMGPNGVIGGTPAGGTRGGTTPGGGVRGVNPAGGVVGGRPGAPGTPGVPGSGAVAGRGGVTGTGGVAGRGGAGAAGRGGAGSAQPGGMVGAAAARGKRGQSDEHGHQWDPDNPWEVAEGVAPVVEAPGEAGPIDPGPAIGGRR